MTLHQLEAFIAVAKHLNITKASRELHVSQSALSHELKRLQATLGLTLIQRNRTGIQLTQTGAVFRNDVEPALSQLRILKTKYGVVTAKEAKEALTLGASHGASASLLPSLMAQFKQAYPSVDLTLYTGTSLEIKDLMLKSKIDIAIATNPGRIAKLVSEAFRSERLSLFVPAGHPLAKMKKVTPREFSRTPIVLRARKDGESRAEEILRRLRKIGCKPEISMRCESFDAVKAAVKSGAGVGILHHDILQDEVRKKEVSILNIKGLDLTYKSYVLYSKRRHFPRQSKAF